MKRGSGDPTCFRLLVLCLTSLVAGVSSTFVKPVGLTEHTIEVYPTTEHATHFGVYLKTDDTSELKVKVTLDTGSVSLLVWANAKEIANGSEFQCYCGGVPIPGTESAEELQEVFAADEVQEIMIDDQVYFTGDFDVATCNMATREELKGDSEDATKRLRQEECNSIDKCGWAYTSLTSDYPCKLESTYGLEFDNDSLKWGGKNFAAGNTRLWLPGMTGRREDEYNTIALVERIKLNPAEYSVNSKDSFAGGILGLAYPALHLRNGQPSTNLTFWSILQQTEPGVLSLDFNDENSPKCKQRDNPAAGEETSVCSWLHVNHLSKEYEDKVVFGPGVPTTRIEYHEFLMFDLSIGGVKLMTRESSWNAIVDLSAACLNLPPRYFVPLMRWLPSKCIEGNPHPDAAEQRAGVKHKVCFLDPSYKNSDISKLPDLSFRLREDGDWIHIPMEKLLTTHFNDKSASTPERRWCIQQGRNATHWASYKPSSQRRIVIGSAVLKSLYTVLDMRDKYRSVGFASKFRPSDVARRSPVLKVAPVVAPAVCKGEQFYNETWNICENPGCQKYIFHTLDEETKTCVVAEYFQVVSFVLFLLVIFAEVGIEWCRTGQEQQAREKSRSL